MVFPTMDPLGLSLGLGGRTSRRISVLKPRKLWSLATDDPLTPGMKEAIDMPSDVAFIGSRHFIMADSNAHHLLLFDREGRLCTVLASGEVWPNCVAVTRDHKIVVTDRKNALVKVYDVHGQCLHAWAEKAPPFVEDFEYRPHGVTTNSMGQIMVSDTVTHKVTVYSPEGEKLFDFGGLGRRTNELHLPFFMATDYEDNIIISDNMNFCVKVFDKYGKYKLTIGSGHDWGKRQFLSPYGVAADPDGNILIVDHLGNKIVMCDKQGNVLAEPVNKKDRCESPSGVAADKLGNIVFTEASLDYTNVRMYALSYSS